LATMTTKGRITVPKAERDVLRLHRGDKVDVIVKDDSAQTRAGRVDFA